MPGLRIVRSIRKKPYLQELALFNTLLSSHSESQKISYRSECPVCVSKTHILCWHCLPRRLGPLGRGRGDGMAEAAGGIGRNRDVTTSVLLLTLIVSFLA